MIGGQLYERVFHHHIEPLVYLAAVCNWSTCVEALSVHQVRSIRGMMEEGMPERGSDAFRRITLRWRIMKAVGAILIALGVFIDWPPRLDPSLPETSSFLLILGALVGGAGFLAGLQHE